MEDPDITGPSEEQPLLGLQFDRLILERGTELLHMQGLGDISLTSKQDFGFTGIVAPLPPLYYVPLKMNTGWEHIVVGDAHERLTNRNYPGYIGDEHCALCLWAIDGIVGNTFSNKDFVFPKNPNPEHRVIIMTRGKYTIGPDGEGYMCNVYLQQEPDGTWKVLHKSKLTQFILYTPAPGFDVVALCAPRETCF